MIAPARIPATVVTGFLGAGKTTLLRHLVTSARGRRIALVINEFGELGIDRELLLGCGDACAEDDVVELANGCICCTVADDFLPTIEKILARRPAPDHIVIETSGLALPKPLVKAFAWPEIRSRVTVDGVVAVVDAAAAATGAFQPPDSAAAASGHENPLEEVFADQIACADLVLLNKGDLLPPEALARVESEIAAALRRGAKLLRTVHSRVVPGVLLGLEAAAESDLASRNSRHEIEGEHDHDDFESFVLAPPPVSAPQEMLKRIAAAVAAHDVIRVKGFLDVIGKPMRFAVQGVGPRLDGYFDRPWHAAEARAGRLVVIGRSGLDRTALRHALGG